MWVPFNEKGDSNHISENTPNIKMTLLLPLPESLVLLCLTLQKVAQKLQALLSDRRVRTADHRKSKFNIKPGTVHNSTVLTQLLANSSVTVKVL